MTSLDDSVGSEEATLTRRIDNIEADTVGVMELYRRGDGADVRLKFAYDLVAVALIKRRVSDSQSVEQFLQEAFTFLLEAVNLAGLRLVDEVAPDVVILDVGLPEMDGLEVARRIRANPRHAGVRLIALTGYGQTGDRLATTQAGFDHHLVKPVQPNELLALLAHLQPSTASQNRQSAPIEYRASATGSADVGVT